MMDCIKKLRAKGIRCAYHRFVDDFILICSDKQAMKWLIKAAEIKIKAMELVMHKDQRYFQPASHGTMFVGSYIKNGRIYLSNRTLGRFRDKAIEISRYLQQPAKEITSYDLDHILATLNSYLGFCKGRKTYRLRRRIMKPLIYSHDFQRYFRLTRNVSKVTLKKRWKTIVK